MAASSDRYLCDRVAILSAGPSVHSFDPAERFDHVVGVRWTAERWWCDWWVLCDAGEYVDRQPIGRPWLFVPPHLPDHLVNFARAGASPAESRELALHAMSRFAHEQVVIMTDGPLPPSPPHCRRVWAYSGMAALSLLWRLRPREAHVWGMDLAGEADGQGERKPSHRPERWESERRSVEWIIDHAEKDLGCRIVFRGGRHGWQSESESRTASSGG